jgi:hypothetical protein
MHMFGRCTHTIEDELGSAAWKTTPLSCKRSDLEKFFRKSPVSQHKKRTVRSPLILSRVPIFENLSKRELAAVVAYFARAW